MQSKSSLFDYSSNRCHHLFNQTLPTFQLNEKRKMCSKSHQRWHTNWRLWNKFNQTFSILKQGYNNFDNLIITSLSSNIVQRLIYYPPCRVEIKTITSFSSSVVSSWPLSSQSQSFTRTRTPGLLHGNRKPHSKNHR